MSNLQQGLIAGKGKKQAHLQKKRFEQCELKIKTLRNKNNELQKQTDNQLQSDIKMAIRAQTSFIQNEIMQLRNMLEGLSRDFPDPGSKKKIKDLCIMASKQMQRNKRIMDEFMNRASRPASYIRKSWLDNAYRRSRTQFQHQPHQSRQDYLPPVKQKHNSSLINSEDMMSDLKHEQQMAAERTALLKQLQAKNNKINQIINQMGSMVGGEQRDMVDAIGDNINEVQYNTKQANDELDQAIVYQKKSKKKFIWIVVTIIVLVLIVGGMIYFLVK